MSPLTPARMETLIICLLRCPIVISSAMDKLRPEHFNQPDEMIYKLLWLLSQEYYATNTVPIPKRILEDSVDYRLGLSPALDTHREDLAQLIDIAYAQDTMDALDPDYVIENYLQPLLNDRVFKEELRSIDMDLDDPGVIITKLTQARSNSTITTVEKAPIFDFENDEEEDKRPATPTGCVVFDALVGGARPAHLTGVLAPYGGGKTLLCTDLAIKVAANKDHAFFFQYEQPVRTNIRPRIWANLTKQPTSLFESTKFADLDAAIQSQLYDYRYVDEYFHIYDMQQVGMGEGGALEIESILQKNARRGIKPTVIAIDWLGILVNNYLGAQGIVTENKTGHYGTIMAQLRRIANVYECEVMLTHQLNTIAGAKANTTRPTMYDAHEYRSFSATVDTCMILCGMDPNGVSRIFNAKNRGSIEDIWIQMRPEICTAELMNTQQFTTVRGQDGIMYNRRRDAFINVE